MNSYQTESILKVDNDFIRQVDEIDRWNEDSENDVIMDKFVDNYLG